MHRLKLFLKFIKYLLPYKKRQIAIIILGGLSALLSLIMPYFSKLIVDNAIINRQLKAFIILGTAGAAVFIANGLIKSWVKFLKKSIEARVNFDLNKKIFTHLQRLPLGFFRNRSTGEHMFKLYCDIEKAVDFIVGIPEELVSIFPRLSFTIAIIFYLDWQLASVTLFIVPFLYLPVRHFTVLRSRILEAFFRSSQDIFKHLEEVFSHIYLVKALGKEKKELNNYLKMVIANVRMRFQNMRLEIIGNAASGSAGRLMIGVVSLFGIYQVIRGRISLGSLTAIMIYLTQLIGLQEEAGFFFQRVSFGLISCSRLEEVLKENPSDLSRGKPAKTLISDSPRIDFQGVSFGYGEGELVFDNLIFSIGKGISALVGPSGCGKTTLLNLILRLYSPLNGEIFINGYNIIELEERLFRANIGVALQEPFLWDDTIENNIRYEDEHAGRAKIIEAARLAGVDEFVNRLPQGYKTTLGENACRLSAGQKQKIAIARALIKAPKILILDEAMSSMDSLSEERIIAQIKKLPVEIIIVVSHRLSTITACDRAYFIKSPGQIISDTPQQLLGGDESFKGIFSAQASNFIQPVV